MGFMDKVREQSTQLAQKAQETAREGKVKLDQAQAKRRADAIFRDLGAAVYAERTGRAGADNAEKINRLVDALSRQEAEQGLGDSPAPAGGPFPGDPFPADPFAGEPPAGEPPAGEPPAGEPPAGEPPAGGFPPAGPPTA